MAIWEKYLPGFKKMSIDTGGVKINTLVAGTGEEAVLLLHGHPENYVMWRGIAPALAEKYTVVLTDLRGYGESDKPRGLPDHANYSKRVMAADQIAVMDHLGLGRFHIAGHDRGARVCHRMLLDHPERVRSYALLDIVSTCDAYALTNREFATKYWHWFFYIQPYDFPEVLLGSNPEYFIRSNLLKRPVRPSKPISPTISSRSIFGTTPTRQRSTPSARITAPRRASIWNTTRRIGSGSSRHRSCCCGARTVWWEGSTTSLDCGRSWRAM